MSQLTIYLDEASMRGVKRSAKREKVSVSLWARRRLCEAVRSAWPQDYFTLFGALSDNDLKRPRQGTFDADATRKSL